MKASEVVETLKSSIRATRSTGAQQISIDDLEAYASRLEEITNKTPENVAAGDAAMEAYKAELNAWAISRQQSHEFNLEMLRSTIVTGQSALKSALLINGGAAVATLAFIGNIWTDKQGKETLFTYLSTSLACFVYGVLVAAFASGCTYISQAGYGNEFGKASKAIGVTGHVLAVLSVLAAYFLFGRGSWLAYVAMGNG